MKITSISIKRSTVPIVMFTILMLMGTFFATKIKYALLPEITTATIVVSTVYPGAGPDEVEKSVTIPIEDAVATVENIEYIDSKSMENLSLLKIGLTFDADVDLSVQNTKQKIDQILKDLPEDIYTPSVMQYDLSALPILIAGANSNLSEADFFDLMNDKVKPALANIKGVATIDLIGGLKREIKVSLNPSKLEAYNVNVLNLMQAIGYANMEFPTGKLKTANNEITIRLSGKFKSIDELRNVIIGGAMDGTVIKLKDVADVYDGIADPEKITRINGLETIGIEVSKQKDANSVEIAAAIKAKFAELEENYINYDLSFKIADDQSRFTLEAANAVKHDLVIAIILVSAIMLFFLQSLRNSIFVLVAIPASLISTFTAMYLFGFSFDLISLTSLSLVVGSLVDDAIVVIENIYRHMEMGKNRIQASFIAVKELGVTVTAITLVLVAVFLPIAFVTGVVGDILREYAVTIVVSMLLSLLVSFTLVPFMTSRYAILAKPKDNMMGKILKSFERFLDKLNNATLIGMHWALRHKIVTILITIVAFIGSLGLIPAGYVGAEFAAAGDRGSFILRLEFPHDISLKENNRISREVEDYLMAQPEIDLVYTTIGKKSGTITTTTTPYYTEFSVNMVPRDQRDVSSNIYAKKVKAKLQERIIGPKIKAVAVNIMGNEDTPLQFYITGNELDSVMVYADNVLTALKSINGTTEAELSIDAANPEYNIEVDRDKMSKLGLSLGEVGSVLRTAFAGNIDNKYRDGENEYDINIQFDQVKRKTKHDLESVSFISSQTNEKIRLSQFTSIEESTGPSVLERYNRNASAMITSQLIGASQATVQAQFEEKLKTIPKPQGTQLEYSAMTKMMTDSFKDLGLAFLAAILFVYLIMVVLYNSWIDPFVVMFSIPLAIIGAFLALALSMQTLNIFSILGIIMLVGLVAKNAILVVDFANELRTEGKELLEAISEAVRLRFRPIIMTNVSMIIGLFPLAFSQSEGAEWKNGIGWTLIGGLTVSMFLSMIIVPMIYYSFKRLQQKFENKNKVSYDIIDE
ncbi:efflux RND transporter permease subunit [Labilibacter sediminis]|nr:efflux RND transporter permease subunit [Labilibacter sediminis]